MSSAGNYVMKIALYLREKHLFTVQFCCALAFDPYVLTCFCVCSSSLSQSFSQIKNFIKCGIKIMLLDGTQRLKYSTLERQNSDCA